MDSLMTYNDVPIPAFMYGTAWKKEQTAHLVELAVDSGFLAIDTANQLIHYQEALVGEALLMLAQKGIKRESLFLQTKFTPVSGQDHRTPYDQGAQSLPHKFSNRLRVRCNTSIQTTWIPMCCMVPTLVGDYPNQIGRCGASMEELYQSGKTKMIGISNVQADQLRELCGNASIKPMVVQNRCYAVMGWDQEVREICKSQGIIYQGFSLLTANQDVLRDSGVWDIAKRLGANPLQVIFRFAMQIGMLPLTGTTNEQHMKDDLAVLSQFDLSQDDLQTIESIAL